MLLDDSFLARPPIPPFARTLEGKDGMEGDFIPLKDGIEGIEGMESDFIESEDSPRPAGGANGESRRG